VARATKAWASATGQGFVTQLSPAGGPPRAVTLMFARRGPDESSPHVVDETTPRFRVELANGGQQVVSAEVRDPEGLSATALQRFPWARWLTVAKASARSEAAAGRPGGSASDPDLRRLVQAATEGKRLRPISETTKRPGRRGHPESFYREVAERYSQLCEQGDPHPRATLANELGYSPNTLAGLLRTARQRGLLGPPKRSA
jgi:hypothetical protein